LSRYVAFSELGMQENDIEEILRCSIDILCDEEESMLIVGRQVQNEKVARSDLTAVDNNGNIVLIEIKRDRKDIENRKEHC
jgi:RecB family endonuclease NucS